MHKLILIGYMGVGKTTTAQLLALKLNKKWVDLDELIEKQTNLSISAIFEQKGEVYFRKLEHETFLQIIESDEQLIISTGGGTPCYANNHLLLNGVNTKSIYLKASIELIFERLNAGKTNRPLVARYSEEELKEFIAKNLFERSYFYNQATYTVNIESKSPEQLADEIIAVLQ